VGCISIAAFWHSAIASAVEQQELNMSLESQGKLSPSRPAFRSPLSVIIVTYNSASTLPGLLDSLSAGLEGVDDFDVTVVDNNSSDNCVELTLTHPIRAKVISMGRNAGYAAAINAATATIQPNRGVLILNPDIRLVRGTVHTLIAKCSDVAVGVVVPKMLNEDGTLALSLRREPSVTTAWSETLLGGKLAARLGIGEVIDNQSLYSQGGHVEWATGAALLISPRARATVRNWDETFFLYSEEVDYLRRVRESGLSVVYVPEAQVVHLGGEYRDNPWLSALLTTNRIRYFRRHHGPAATAMFRLGILVGEAMRCSISPSHRASFRAALAPVWSV
jgi:N-acetylglucosaminyl-diphospho-decaprenol L-rhamnosyltransferase